MKRIAIILFLISTFYISAQTQERYELDNTNEAYLNNAELGNIKVYYIWGTKRQLIQNGILEKDGFWAFRFFQRPKAALRPDMTKYRSQFKYNVSYIKPDYHQILYPRDVYPARTDENSKFRVYCIPLLFSNHSLSLSELNKCSSNP